MKIDTTVASFTKEVNPRLAKRPLKTNGRLANRGLTFLVKEATGGRFIFLQLTLLMWSPPWFVSVRTHACGQNATERLQVLPEI